MNTLLIEGCAGRLFNSYDTNHEIRVGFLVGGWSDDDGDGGMTMVVMGGQDMSS